MKSKQKILKEIIQLENTSKSLKEMVGIFAVTPSLKSMQMTAAKFKEIFDTYTIEENYDKKYRQYKTAVQDYEIFALEKKESSQDDNGN